jgi:AcrR family transcriptional regulator
LSQHTFPRPDLATKTRDDLLDQAGAVAADFGLEAVSLTMLADWVGVPVEQIYQNFDSRAALVDALVERLLNRQTEAANIWFGRYSAQGRAVMSDHVEDLLHALYLAGRSVTGADLLQQALISMPHLAERRMTLRSQITDQFVHVLSTLDPSLSRDRLWARYRIAVDMALSAQSLAASEPHEGQRERVIREAARVLRFALEAA